MKPASLEKVKVAQVLLRTGMMRPFRPDRALRVAMLMREWGPSLASGYMAGAIRVPNRLAVIDERGTLTFKEIDLATNALADSLRRRGINSKSRVALMCRNHRGFIEATVALTKLGADLTCLNTEFAAPAVAQVLARERVDTLIYDQEFAPLAAEAAGEMKRFVAYHEPEEEPTDPPLEALIAAGYPARPPVPPRSGKIVILTSGTTGAPKGALRESPASLEPAAAIYSVMPFRALETTVIAAPLFHSWGFAHVALSLPLSSTLVLRRRFDPEQTLRAVAEHRATALVVVPVMLQRMLDLPRSVRSRYDTSCLRVIASSGSALPGELALEVMDAFGDVLYNLYGSTEVAWVSVAGPADLRAAPGTAGRPPLGTALKLLDERGREVPTGQRGRIFAGNSFVFQGYTDGSHKEVAHGLLATGDVGHLDQEGRLFVDGRDDEMIVSGGENVYPREVEDLLAGHEQIEEVAVVGVPDEEFGARLRAYVVPRNGARLTEEEIKAYVRGNLARYKVPRDVVFVEALPRNATGKVVKRLLQSGSWAA